MLAVVLPQSEKWCETPRRHGEVVELAVSVADGRSFPDSNNKMNKQERETRCAKVKDAESKGGGTQAVFSCVMRWRIRAALIRFARIEMEFSLTSGRNAASPLPNVNLHTWLKQAAPLRLS